MKDETLEEFVRRVSFYAEKIFNKMHVFRPMLHFVSATGEAGIAAIIADDKDGAAEAMRALLKEKLAVRVAFIDECWIKTFPLDASETEILHSYQIGLRNDPKRIEALMITAEDANGKQIMAHRVIERPVGHKPYLAALQISDGPTEGRFSNLLTPQGSLH